MEPRMKQKISLPTVHAVAITDLSVTWNWNLNLYFF